MKRVRGKKELWQVSAQDLWPTALAPDDESRRWGDLTAEGRDAFRKVLEARLQVEISGHILAHGGNRNGYYERLLATPLGEIPIRVPRLRKGSFQSSTIQPYCRRTPEMEGCVTEMFVAGGSTRRVASLLDRFWGHAVSPSTVSRMLRPLDSGAAQFHLRPLVDTYEYLILDGVVLTLKAAKGVTRRVVLTACGLDGQGRPELLDYRQVKAESAVQCAAFLWDLYRRGFTGKSLRMVLTDGSGGLHAAIAEVFPFVPLQRCWAHKVRNVLDKVLFGQRADCLSGLRAIYRASTRREAVAAFSNWSKKWQPLRPHAVRCLEHDQDDLFTFYEAPPDLRSRLRTTNLLERAFREVRRRTRAIRVFTNRQSCERILFAILMQVAGRWRMRSRA